MSAGILLFALSFQLGWYPLAQFQGNGGPVFEDGQFYQEAEVSATLLKVFQVGGSLHVRDWRVENGFFPDQLDSIFFVRVFLGPFTLGFEHRCIHPVVPWHSEGQWDAASEQFYIRLRLEYSPF